ncbi:MAG TPA: hypothetical protein VFT05_02840 [Burkholderiaceae bacterium]|nr:hypothetical protein [Burkholderiaceae bacterium]
MKAQLWHNGPYLHALGWLNADYSVTAAAMSAAWQGQHGPVDFDGAGGYALRQGERLPDALPPAIGRASGVARARSAAQSTVYAALLGKGLLQTLPEARHAGERLGVAIASTSDTTGISHEFEASGVRLGWSKTDTMLLPSSIPSAITTQTSAVFDTHAAALAFGDGAMGLCAALEYAYLSFLHQRSDAFVVIGADETCTVQTQALAALDDRRPRTTGASGLLLTRTPPASGARWQLVLCAQAAYGEPIALPAGWHDATRLTVAIANTLHIYTAPLIALAVHQLLRDAARRALLFFTMHGAAGDSSFVLGFECTNQAAEAGS